MTKHEKIQWLQQHAPKSYYQARVEAIHECDELTPVFCFCGAIATGFHTQRCKKYQDKMNSAIIHKLKLLLPK